MPRPTGERSVHRLRMIVVAAQGTSRLTPRPRGAGAWSTERSTRPSPTNCAGAQGVLLIIRRGAVQAFRVLAPTPCHSSARPSGNADCGPIPRWTLRPGCAGPLPPHWQFGQIRCRAELLSNEPWAGQRTGIARRVTGPSDRAPLVPEHCRIRTSTWSEVGRDLHRRRPAVPRSLLRATEPMPDPVSPDAGTDRPRGPPTPHGRRDQRPTVRGNSTHVRTGQRWRGCRLHPGPALRLRSPPGRAEKLGRPASGRTRPPLRTTRSQYPRRRWSTLHR